MTKKNSGHKPASLSAVGTLLQAGAATLGAAAFPMPGIAQTKPFAGVTLRGASFQHRFFTLLQNYIPEFEAQTGMKVDLQLSAFPVYNQQANLELSSGRLGVRLRQRHLHPCFALGGGGAARQSR